MAADPDFLQDLLDFRTLVRFSKRINKALEGKEPADFGVLRGLLRRKLYPVAGLTLRRAAENFGRHQLLQRAFG